MAERPGHRFATIRAGGILAAVAVSLFWLALEVLPVATRFVAENRYPKHARSVAAVGAALVFVATFLFVWFKRPPAFARRYRWPRIAAALAPLAVAWTIPVLFSRELWKGAEIQLLAFAGASALVLERLLRRALPLWCVFVPRLRGPMRLGRATRLAARLVLVAAVTYYVVRISGLALESHEKMQSRSSDLAEFDNLFFNALHGHPFRSPAIEGELADWSALKVHAEFLIYALLPFYALAPGPKALIVIQTVVIALTAVPIYALAARRLGELAGAVFAFAFVVMPAVQQPNFYDFHFTPVGMLCVATTLALLDAYLTGQRTRLRLASVIGAFSASLLAREDVAFGMVIVGLVVATATRDTRLGIGLAAGAAAWFVVMKFLVMPLFGTMWFSAIYKDLKAPGHGGFGAVVLTLLTNPGFVLRRLLTEERLLYVLHLLVPLAFLWVRRPILLLAALPAIPFTLLATNRPPLYQISFQYVYHWIPYVVAASVFGLELTCRGSLRKIAALTAVLAGSAVAGYHYGALLGAPSIRGGFTVRHFGISDEEQERVAALREVVANIPEEASVAATESEGPHVSTRLVMYSLKFGPGHEPEYVLLGPDVSDDEAKNTLEVLRTGDYGLVVEDGGFTLLRRGGNPTTIEAIERRLKRIAKRN